MPDYSYSRISITLPPEVLAAADRLARSLDRPRSWVFAEALRRFDGMQAESPARIPPARPTSVAPAAAGAPDPEPDAVTRLPIDLSLSAEERVRSGEAMARADQPTARHPGDQILFFNRFEEYLRWDARSRGAG